jgi:hypothetical protein
MLRIWSFLFVALPLQAKPISGTLSGLNLAESARVIKNSYGCHIFTESLD